MVDAETVRMLIANGENEKTEFKKVLIISSDTRAEAIRDFIAMANTHGKEAGYILVGVDNDGVIHSIGKSVDSAQLEQWINELIEPRIDFRYTEVDLVEGRVGVFEIPFSRQRFHMVKKDFRAAGNKHGLARGQQFIRHNTSKRPPTPWDMHIMKEAFATSDERNPVIEVSFVSGSQSASMCSVWDDGAKFAVAMKSEDAPESPKESSGTVSLDVAVKNAGTCGAENVTVVLQLPCSLRIPDTVLASTYLSKVISCDRRENQIVLKYKGITHGLAMKPTGLFVSTSEAGSVHEIEWSAHADNMKDATVGLLQLRIDQVVTS